VNATRLPFRLGATSYVYEADLLTNARRLAGQVDDVELVLFHTPTASNLPDKATLATLADLAAETGLSYTVHLPADVGPGRSTDLALEVIRASRPLAPWGYVVHLSDPNGALGVSTGRSATSELDADQLSEWLDTMRRALDRLARAAGGYECLCLENLEGWPPELFLSLLDDVPISLCIDVGHFWRQRRDPLSYLAGHLPRARVLHLHGCNGDGRDHQPLAVTPKDDLWRVLGRLRGYRGVLTLEVFGLSHFRESRGTLLEGWENTECD